MSENDEKPPAAPEGAGAEIVSIEDARKKNDKPAEPLANAVANAAASEAFNNALQPIMVAIARELAGLAGPDGAAKLDGLSDEQATKAKTDAVLRGLGQGLGEALTQALAKWGTSKVSLNMGSGQSPVIKTTPIRSSEPTPTPGDDPTKK